MPKEEVPIAKVDSSSATERSKEDHASQPRRRKRKRYSRSWLKVWNKCPLSKMNVLLRPKRDRKSVV